MASGISHATIAGNLTRDPEINESGKVLKFGVAVNRNEKNADGEYGEVAHFFDCKVLGNRAQPLSGILVKGMRVTVVGDLVQERWEAQDGSKRSAVLVLAREVVIGGEGKPAESAPDRDAETGGW